MNTISNEGLSFYIRRWPPSKTLSMKGADYVTCNKTTQWAYDLVIKEDMFSRYLPYQYKE